MEPLRWNHPKVIGIVIDGDKQRKTQSKFYGQAERAISNGKLNVLLRLHIRPINVIVYHGSSGRSHLWEGFVLICIQHLS